MCGIIGMYGENDKQLLKKMCDILSHRGPDSYGHYIDNDIMLGHRRLSILDLSKNGKQPMSNKEGTIWITYNGEIYNYLELKNDLEKRGEKRVYDFKSKTDTEVLIYAYQEYGIDFLKKLDGMFAFGIWDSEKKKLILARDNLGIKPLYYAFVSNGIIFASEIKSLLLHPEIKREINKEAINFFLHLDYYPGEKTFFNGIYQLLPGHYLTFEKDKKNGRTKTEKRQFWDVHDANVGIKRYSEQYYLEKYQNILNKTIKDQMISDVPLGAYLSGGIDSTTVVAEMSRLSEQPIKTFSIGFGMDDDELYDARSVAETFGTEHNEMIIKDTSLKMLPKMIWNMDEPKREPIQEYFIAEFARKKVKVALSGIGGDELFAGYIRHRYAAKSEMLKRIVPSSLSKLTYPLYTISGKKSLIKRGLLYINTLNDETKNYLSFAPRQVYDEEIPQLMKFEKDSKNIEEHYKKLLNKPNPQKVSYLDRVLYAELKTYLPSHLFTLNDRQSMANSLECRVPISGKNLVEFAFSLPQDMKIRGNIGKYIMRKHLQDNVPRSILEKRKQGFRVNPKKWLGGELGEYAKQILTKERIEKDCLFKWDYVERLLREKHKINLGKSQYFGQDFHIQQLWNLLAYHLWEDIYFKNGNSIKSKLSSLSNKVYAIR